MAEQGDFKTSGFNHLSANSLRIGTAIFFNRTGGEQGLVSALQGIHIRCILERVGRIVLHENQLGSDMADDGIPLRDAPERCFDQEKWSEFVRCCGSRDAALKALSKPPARATTETVWPDLAKSPDPEKAAEAREKIRVYGVGNALVAQFKERLRKGEIVATAVSDLDVDRVRIPAERWKDLRPNFVEGKAEKWVREKLVLVFESVVLFEPVNRSTEAAARLEQCKAWLRQLPDGDKQLRKVLQARAMKLIPSLKDREFTTAYAKVFDKQRGRPRKTKLK